MLPWESGAAYPDWSPTGHRIALVLRADVDTWDGPADIHLVALDGTGLTAVTAFGVGGGRAIQPSFTPDGREIIFVAETTVFQPRVGRIALDGSGQAVLDNPDARTHPRLRPTR